MRKKINQINKLLEKINNFLEKVYKFLKELFLKLFYGTKSKKKSKKKKKTPTFRTSDAAILVVITAILGLVIGGVATLSILFKMGGFSIVSNTVPSEEMLNFIKEYNFIKDNYFGTLNDQQLLDGALSGVLDSIGDPHTSLLDEEESKSFELMLDGSYEGLGVQIQNNADGNIVIVNLFEDSPAVASGLKVGDVLVGLDGQDMHGKVASSFSNYVLNATKKDFTITYLRDGKETTISIAKKTIIIKSVFGRIIQKNNKKVGYIKVDIFSATTYNQFKNVLEELESQNINSLIIDLRDNSGGHLSVVEDMASLFLKSKHIVYQTEDKDGIEKIYSSGEEDKTYPIIFLGNSATASASELMIGALKDNLNAKLVGNRTFGKGTVQQLQDLPSGASFKITIKRWLTPNGTWIHNLGFTPDFEVTLDEDYAKNPSDTTDNQLQKALEEIVK
jgi:carboxyl-terminal processing protease